MNTADLAMTPRQRSSRSGEEAPPLEINYQYELEWASRLAAKRPGIRILDYGCGSGQVVQAGRVAGLDIQGSDVFYAGSRSKSEAEGLGLLGNVVFEIHDGVVPFPDGHFDFIMSTQVLEHVVDLDATLSEIARVLKDDGVLLSIFPSRQILREGHIGIPLAHLFPKGNSRLRYMYTLALRRAGLGYNKPELDAQTWTREQLQWIDDFTFYRGRREIEASFGRWFNSAWIEEDYVRFRMERAGKLRTAAPLLNVPMIADVCRHLMWHFASMVIVSTKTGSSRVPSARPFG